VFSNSSNDIDVLITQGWFSSNESRGLGQIIGIGVTEIVYKFVIYSRSIAGLTSLALGKLQTSIFYALLWNYGCPTYF